VIYQDHYGCTVSNTAPVARNDRGIINEDATLNVSNNANANVSADNNINTTGEHSGDVINTNLAGRQDTDADGDTLTVTEIRTEAQRVVVQRDHLVPSYQEHMVA